MKKVSQQLNDHFQSKMSGKPLFRSNISGEVLWDIYIDSFSKEHNPVFRDPSSTAHNCNLCNNFIRRYGNIVALDENLEIISLFDFEVEEEYSNSFKLMSETIKNSSINSIFIETYQSLNSLPYEKCSKNQEEFQLGIKSNFKKYTEAEAKQYSNSPVKPGEIKEFNHLSLIIPKNYVDTTGKSIAAIESGFRDKYIVFKRAIEEIPLETLLLVKDLITQDSLLNGTSYLPVLEAIIEIQKDISDSYRNSDIPDNYFWIKSYELSTSVAKFRSTLLGTLCVDLAEGVELNKACRDWNKRADPANYMKAKAPITETQKKQAKEFAEEQGYLESFNRRFALLDDIKANEIKYINVNEDKVKAVSIFDKVQTKSTRHKKSNLDDIQEIPIRKFMSDVLPNCDKIEALVENRHINNFVSLTTSEEKSKPMFKWDNPFSWTYRNNLAGKSMIKEAVKSQGGKVDGVLRFSIMWSEENSIDDSDLDAHCLEPNNHRIYYRDKISHKTGGNLDIDITQPLNHKKYGREVVENITYPSIEKMTNGSYRFQVHQFSERQSQGFKAEIEFDGQIFEYSFDKRVKQGRYIDVATVSLHNNKFEIAHHLDPKPISKTVYNIETENFHPVNLVCLSPNYWGENKIGNKHYFFMLEKAKADNSLRSFHTENLNSELAEHRKFLDILGNITMIEPQDKQLSGIGFNSTVRDSIVLKLSGSFKRMVRVKF